MILPWWRSGEGKQEVECKRRDSDGEDLKSGLGGWVDLKCEFLCGLLVDLMWTVDRVSTVSGSQWYIWSANIQMREPEWPLGEWVQMEYKWGLCSGLAVIAPLNMPRGKV